MHVPVHRIALLAFLLYALPAFGQAGPQGLYFPGTIPGTGSNSFTNIHVGPGSVSIIGGSGNGTDQITNVNVNGVMNVMAFGARCDGTTDDAPAIQVALNALGNGGRGNALYIPPSANGCRIGTPLTYTTYNQSGTRVSGPVKIFGDGPTSKLVVTNITGGLDIEGSCGSQGQPETANLRDFSIVANAGATIGYGIKVYGTSQSNISGVIAQGFGPPNQFAVAFDLFGMQQSTVIGDVSNANIKGIVLDNCHSTGTGGYSGSNATPVIGFASVSDQGTASVGVDIEGGTGDNAIIDAHMSGANIGVLINQNGANTGGCGDVNFYNLHTENDSTAGVDFRSANCGAASLYGWNDFNGGGVSLHTENGAQSIAVYGGLLNGKLQFDATPAGLIKVLNNTCLETTPVNNAGIGKVISYGLNTNCPAAVIPGAVAQFETPIIGKLGLTTTNPNRANLSGGTSGSLGNGASVAVAGTGNNMTLDLLPGNSLVNCRFFLTNAGTVIKEIDSGGTAPVCGIVGNAATCGAGGTSLCSWDVYNAGSTWNIQNYSGATDTVSYKLFGY